MRGQQEQEILAPRLNNTGVPGQQVPYPQIWLRRQELPQQWVPAEFAPIERVERINMVMVCYNQRVEFTQHNLYVMDVDKGNMNCYSCERFGHLVRNCRNKGTENRIGESRRLEYRNKG